MPPRQVQNFAFPASGLSENFGYETQPPGTTVSAQNVRAYDDSTGRMRGGQRPGLKKFTSERFSLTNTAGTNPKAFQSLVQLTGTDVSKSAGDKSVALPLYTSSTSKMVVNGDFPGSSGVLDVRQTANLKNQVSSPVTDLNGTVELSTYDKDGNLYVASVNTAEDSGKFWVLLHKISHRPATATPDITSVKLAHLTAAIGDQRRVIGMGHYNGHLYLYTKGNFVGAEGSLITSGTSTNKVLKVKDDLTALVAQSASSFYTGNDSHHDADAATRNLLAVGHDRLYIAVRGPSSTHRNVNVRAWRLGLQEISDTPAANIEVATNPDSSGEARRMDMALSNKGDLYILYSIIDSSDVSSYKIAKVKRDLSGLDSSFGTSGVVTGTNTIYSMSYCTRTDRLAVSGLTDGTTGIFANIVCHVAMLHNETGAVVAPSTSNGPRFVSGVNGYEGVRAKGDGELVLTRMKTSTTVEVVSSTSIYEHYLTDDDWTDGTGSLTAVTGSSGNSSNKKYDVANAQPAAANRAGAAMLASIYRVYDLEFGEKSTFRQSYIVGVGEGTIRVMEMTPDPALRDWKDVSNGSNALEHSAPIIFGVPFYGRQNSTPSALTTAGVRDPVERPIYAAFFVDGYNKKFYDFYDNKVKAWTSNDNLEKGSSFPEDSGGMFPTLIESWRGRIVMSGLPNEPHNWFMTATGTMDDWQYFPQVITEYTAAAGHVSDAGQMPDVVRGMVPFSDDVIIFLGDRSVWQLSGDPMSGGRFDLLSDKTGGAWGRAWCKDSHGVAYFFGSTGGVYRIAPRGMPERITSGVIDRRLRDVDLSTTIVRMEWNEKAQGINLFFTKNDLTSKEECLFYDARTNSWWPDKYDHIAHNSPCMVTYDADTSGDREVVIGGRDGNMYYFDPSQVRDQTHDSLVDIDSHVFLGPVGQGQKTVLDEITGKVALDSGEVKWDLHAGSSSEAALPGNIIGDDASNTARGKVGSGTWTPYDLDGDGDADSGKVVERMRATGDSIYLKLYNGTSPTKRWAFESVQFQFHSTGREAGRSI